MIGFEYILLGISVLILVSIVITRATSNIGVPSLLLFLTVGMLAGVDGPGGYQFSDTGLAQAVGCIALILILFSGGLDTDFSHVRAILMHGVSLATVGVLTTALAVGVFVSYLLGFTWLEGLLLGAVISSTDAAAVFSVLRSKDVHLKSPLKPLLEFESGSNDPMAVFLTISFIQLITGEHTAIFDIVTHFILQMGIGVLLGFLLGKLMVTTINRLKLPYEGIYPVFVLSFAFLIYTSTVFAQGSGFLAVYVAGIVLGNSSFVQKKSLLRFFDGFAWLSQICMFLTLGLLVNPHELPSIIVPALLIAAFLMFVARPMSVFLAMGTSRYSWRERTFISWVGLRGAAPIILATFPLLAGVAHANTMFNIVFFIVLTSALLQGWTLPITARLLRVDAPAKKKALLPIEAAPVEGLDTELVDLNVPHGSAIAGKTIIELELPRDSLIALVGRNEEFIVPSGSTVLEEGDTLLVIVKRNDLPAVREILSRV